MIPTWDQIAPHVAHFADEDTARAWARAHSGTRGHVWRLRSRYYPASMGSNLENRLHEQGAVLIPERKPAAGITQVAPRILAQLTDRFTSRN